MATMTDGGERKPGEEFRARARAGLPPEVVRRLSRLSPLRSTIAVLETWGAIAALVALAVWTRHPLVVAACIVGIAAQQHGLAVLAHEAAHYRMYETRWVNDLVGRLCGFPLGLSMITYRVIHRIHHNHLYSSVDPDLALMAGYPRGRAYLAKKLLKDLSGVSIIKNYLYFLGRPSAASGEEARRPLDDTSDGLRAAAARDRRFVLVANIAVVVSMIATGAWGFWLLLWVLPLVTLLQAILRLRAVCEHGAVPETSDPRRAARTTLAPWWSRWILFPHSVHYHIEHHLYPSVPHYRLKECHAAFQAAGLCEGAEVVPTLGQTLGKIFSEPRAQA